MPEPQFSSIASASRGEMVAETLRRAIVSGRLRPGDRLPEIELADQLGTSRAPVREGLRRLEYEGLVVTRPYKGTKVAEVTQEEIEEVLVPVRVVLERHMFRKALGRLTEDDFTELDRLVTVMRYAGQARDADALAEADLRFHELVMNRAEQPHSLQLWSMIEPRVRAHFRRDAPEHLDPQEVADQHQELLDAVRTGVEAAVVEAVESHIQRFLTTSGEPRS